MLKLCTQLRCSFLNCILLFTGHMYFTLHTVLQQSGDSNQNVFKGSLFVLKCGVSKKNHGLMKRKNFRPCFPLDAGRSRVWVNVRTLQCLHLELEQPTVKAFRKNRQSLRCSDGCPFENDRLCLSFCKHSIPLVQYMCYSIFSWLVS